MERTQTVSTTATATETNAETKANTEEITIAEADDELQMAEGAENPFYDAFKLYKTVNNTKVKADINDGESADEACDNHTYYVLVDTLRGLVLQSTDPHARFRLTSENSDHEDKLTGSKHEVAVAKSFGYDVLPHADNREDLSARLGMAINRDEKRD